MNDWKLLKLSDFVYFNPRESIPKNLNAKKVAMDQLHPYMRDIPRYELAPYNGGAKFRNGDTIMARITPCLENGKTAQVNILDDDEVGFGSTEFIVLRPKPGISDRDFIYYLATSPFIRDRAILSMVGSSGRQRVQQGVLNDIELLIPPLKEQTQIGTFLKLLDDKIANNNAINHHLMQMAQAIFKSWFVDFEPWDGKMPNDWRDGTLSDICIYSSKRIPVASLTVDTYISTENMSTDKGGFVIATSLPTIPQTTAFTVGDTLISNIRPYFKKIVYCGFTGGCSTDVLCFHPNKANLSLYVYNALYSDSFFNHMVAGSRGTKMPRGDKQQIMNYYVVIPPDTVIGDFNNSVSAMIEKRHLLTQESARLAELRNTLLPRLMSGELSIADLDEAK